MEHAIDRLFRALIHGGQAGSYSYREGCCARSGKHRIAAVAVVSLTWVDH